MAKPPTRESWLSGIRRLIRKFKESPGPTMAQLGASSAFGVCLGSALYPLNQALQSPNPFAALTTLLGGPAASVVGSFLYDWMKDKKAPGNPEELLPEGEEQRTALDGVLKESGVAEIAREVLGEEWEPFRKELEKSAHSAGLSVFAKSVHIEAKGPVHVHVAGNLYQSFYNTGPGQRKLTEDEFDALLKKYLGLVEKDHGQIRLHGRQSLQRGTGPLPKPLGTIYTSLRVSADPKTLDARRGKRTPRGQDAEGPRGLDMRDLLTFGERIAIIGSAGSGKSTYVSFVASELARAHLGEGSLDERLDPPKPDQPLPLPIVLPLRFWNVYRESVRSDKLLKVQKPRAHTLAGFLAWCLEVRYSSLGETADFFDRLLERKGCLLLLDGIDEVVSPEERQVLRDAVRQFIDVEYPGNQCIVTGRPAGHEDAPFGDDFVQCTIQDMSDKEIASLIHSWCEQLYPDEGTRGLAENDIVRSATTLNEERESRGQPRFITTPLLVTMVVSVRYSHLELPRERVKLYDACVEVVLRALYSGDEDQVGGRKAIVEVGGEPGKIREWLTILAFHMHRGRKGDARAVIGELGIRDCLQPILAARGEPKELLGRFIGAVRKRGGLLETVGTGFQFMHLTFQEYLAGKYLSALDFKEKGNLGLLKEIATDEWWREALLLAVGSLASPEPYSGRETLVKALCQVKRYRAALPAAEIAASGLLDMTGPEDALKKPVAERIRHILTKPGYLNATSPKARARAGAAINLLPGGDGRPGMGLLVTKSGLPDFQWCNVPGGTLMMGTAKGEADASENQYGPDGKPCRVEVGGFRFAAYPITSAQFSPFAEGDGYRNRGYWTDAGWQWKEEKCLCEPWLWRETKRNLVNHPVVGVSWYEAVAYCNWLTDQLRKERELGPDQCVTLPTEAQWEWAARGPDGNTYPWGNEWDPHACFSWESGIRKASAVGIFPSGVSAWLERKGQRVRDLAGNVWEWCQTLHKGYPYREDDGREKLEADGERVLRGGSWNSPAARCCCAYRAHDTPEGREADVGFRVVRPLP